MFGRPGRGQPRLALYQQKRPPPALYEDGFFAAHVIQEVFTEGLIVLIGQPWYIRNPPPGWEFFRDTFFASIPFTTEVDQHSVTPGSGFQPWLAYTRPKLPSIEAEADFPRTNQQTIFNLQGIYVAQLVGYTFDQPDFNDNPWLEELHRPLDPSQAIFPFRQIPQFIRGQQFNLYFNQPKPWLVDAEIDQVIRSKNDYGLALIYARPFVTVFVVVPNLVGLTQTQAITTMNLIGLLTTPITQAFSTTVPINVVISQTVAAGTVVPFGSSVGIQVSLGPFPTGTIFMPNLVGMLWLDASRILFYDGLSQNQGPIQVIANFPEPGTVIGQAPIPGTLLFPGTNVELTVTSAYLVSAAFET